MTHESSKSEGLRKIRDEVFSGAHLPLYNERIKNTVYPVIGEGNHDASVMLVGEAPGRTEAQTGRPFCGAAGNVLDILLESVGIKRASVYITNLVKDRPPMNRDPEPNEIEAYAPYLMRQVEIIKPKVIAALGRHSMSYLMKVFGLAEEGISISKIHGKTYEVKALYGNVRFLPLFHPAVAIYNSEMLDVLKEDIKNLLT